MNKTIQPLGPIPSTTTFILAIVRCSKLYVMVKHKAIDENQTDTSTVFIPAYVITSDEIKINPILTPGNQLTTPLVYFRPTNSNPTSNIETEAVLSTLIGEETNYFDYENDLAVLGTEVKSLKLVSSKYTLPPPDSLLFSGAPYRFYQDDGTEISYNLLDTSTNQLYTVSKTDVYPIAVNFFSSSTTCASLNLDIVSDPINAFNCSYTGKLDSATRTYCLSNTVKGFTLSTQCTNNPNGYQYCAIDSSCGTEGCYGMCPEISTPCTATSNSGFQCQKTVETIVYVSQPTFNQDTSVPFVTAPPTTETNITWWIVIIIIIIIIAIVALVYFLYNRNDHQHYYRETTQTYSPMM